MLTTNLWIRCHLAMASRHILLPWKKITSLYLFIYLFFVYLFYSIINIILLCIFISHHLLLSLTLFIPVSPSLFITIALSHSSYLSVLILLITPSLSECNINTFIIT